ncbi:MAG TPA: hypothetical protein EYH38_09910 [Leucothrix sp.]|nr:hypothetical protein [Leucothrix sp.]
MRQAKQVMGQYKQEIEQLQLQIKAGEKRTLDLQKSYDSAQRSLSKGQSATMSSQLKIAELMTHLTHYKKQLAEAQDALSTQEKEAKTAVPSDEEIVARQELQRQIDQSEQLVAEQKAEIEVLQKSFQQAIDDKQDIASKLDEFKEQSSLYLSTAMEESRRYRQGVEFLQEELDKCQKELSAIPALDIKNDHLSEPTPEGGSKSKSNLMPRLDKIEHAEVYDTDVEDSSVFLADDESKTVTPEKHQSKIRQRPHMNKLLRRKRRR